MAAEQLTFRAPRETDGARVWALVGRGGGLEQNTCYAYVLLCSHFADTCVVAELDGALAGFVMAYRPPSHPDEIFVWQVAVAPEARGRGLGAKLLAALLERPGARGARFLSATVSPDNAASLALFHGFARRREVPCQTEPGFPSTLFAAPHEDENLLRIGPLKGTN